MMDSLQKLTALGGMCGSKLWRYVQSLQVFNHLVHKMSKKSKLYQIYGFEIKYNIEIMISNNILLLIVTFSFSFCLLFVSCLFSLFFGHLPLPILPIIVLLYLFHLFLPYLDLTSFAISVFTCLIFILMTFILFFLLDSKNIHWGSETS